MDGLTKFALWCVCGFLVLTMLFMESPEKASHNIAMATSTQPTNALDTEAEKIVQSGKNLNSFLSYNGTKKNTAEQKKGMERYIQPLTVKQKITQAETYAVNNFIIYGTPSTSMYVADQRFLMLKEYKKSKNQLPKTVGEWRTMLELFGK